MTTPQQKRIQDAINYTGSYKFTGPKNLYCGNIGCSENNNPAIIGKYCSNTDGSFRRSRGTPQYIISPPKNQISESNLAGYIQTHAGIGCNTTRHYIKDPKWGT